MKSIVSIISVIILAGVCICGCGSDTQPYLTVTEQDVADTQEPIKPQPDTEAKQEQSGHIIIYVCGEVESPGVYELPAESRLCDAVEAAGGLTDAASREYWNLAEPLSDGQMICFPTKEEALKRQEAAAVTGAPESGDNPDTRVNINTATKEQLMTVPGVGQTRAEAIIAYREAQGGFECTEDIMQVSGIKDALYQKMKDYITVN